MGCICECHALLEKVGVLGCCWKCEAEHDPLRNAISALAEISKEQCCDELGSERHPRGLCPYEIAHIALGKLTVSQKRKGTL